MSTAHQFTLVTHETRQAVSDLPPDQAAVTGDREGLELLAALLRAWGDQGLRIDEIVDAMMPPDVISPARAVQAQRNADLRASVLARTTMLDSAQVADLLGSDARNRSAITSRLVREGRLLAVERGRRRYFPEFQFDLERGRPRPEIGELVRELAGRGVTGWAALLWLNRRSGRLDGATPLDLVVQSPERVREAIEDIGVGGG